MPLLEESVCRLFTKYQGVLQVHFVRNSIKNKLHSGEKKIKKQILRYAKFFNISFYNVF